MYRPMEIRGRLHTGGKTVDEIRERYTGQGLTYRNFESLQRAFDLFDGQEMDLYRKEDGGAPTYYVAAWPKANGKIMDGVYEAEQTHPEPMYQGQREKFLAYWLSGRYNARMAFEFPAEDVEELEVVGEVAATDKRPLWKRPTKEKQLPRWRQVKEKRARRRKGRGKA